MAHLFPQVTAVTPWRFSFPAEKATNLPHLGFTLTCVHRYNLYQENTVELLYKEHIGTLETVLYIEVVLNPEVIVQWNLFIKDTFNSEYTSNEFHSLQSEVLKLTGLTINLFPCSLYIIPYIRCEVLGRVCEKEVTSFKFFIKIQNCTIYKYNNSTRLQQVMLELELAVLNMMSSCDY